MNDHVLAYMLEHKISDKGNRSRLVAAATLCPPIQAGLAESR